MSDLPERSHVPCAGCGVEQPVSTDTELEVADGIADCRIGRDDNVLIAQIRRNEGDAAADAAAELYRRNSLTEGAKG